MSESLARLVAELSKRHTPTDPEDGFCRECGSGWPCDTALLIRAIRKEA